MQNPLSFDQLKKTAPSIFATNPSSKMTERYVFVPTMEILENFQKEGWDIYSAKQSGRTIHSKHEVRLRNGKMPKVGDCLVEAIISNSHNGLSAFSMSAGLHRFVCSNGLTIPESVSQNFKVSHKSLDLGEVRRLTDDFAEKLPLIEGSMQKMTSRILTMDEKVGFVKSASTIRWKDGMPKTMSIEDILKPQREGDTRDDMWTTFNVVQEKFVRGGIGYRAGKKFTSMRELKNISNLNKVNTKLWELAESYC